MSRERPILGCLAEGVAAAFMTPVSKTCLADRVMNAAATPSAQKGIVLHAFDGKCPFGEEALQRIADLKRIYGLGLDSSTSHRLVEEL